MHPLDPDYPDDNHPDFEEPSLEERLKHGAPNELDYPRPEDR